MNTLLKHMSTKRLSTLWIKLGKEITRRVDAGLFYPHEVRRIDAALKDITEEIEREKAYIKEWQTKFIANSIKKGLI